jgi:hypothetical protein
MVALLTKDSGRMYVIKVPTSTTASHTMNTSENGKRGGELGVVVDWSAAVACGESGVLEFIWFSVLF